jgi:hypothetical protein
MEFNGVMDFSIVHSIFPHLLIFRGSNCGMQRIFSYTHHGFSKKPNGDHNEHPYIKIEYDHG